MKLNTSPKACSSGSRNIANAIANESVNFASRAEGQLFALNQFRSPAYNFDVSVTRSENIKLAGDLERSAVNS
jgi:hypothetical protein